jgi:hypothetical protein
MINFMKDAKQGFVLPPDTENKTLAETSGFVIAWITFRKCVSKQKRMRTAFWTC